MVKEAEFRNALMHIQDLIARETGAPLGGDAEKRMEEILQKVTRQSRLGEAPENFLSREVTILIADLRGFTSISEHYPAGVVLDLLNRYLAKMTRIVVKNGGTIDKFMGDSIMVLFGAPNASEDDIRHAVTCAVEMQIGMGELNGHHKTLGLPELFMGIGINTGTVMAGLIGSDLYSEFTVIGNEVNLASRIEAFSLRGQILISENTYQHCRGFVETGEPMSVYVKGKAEPVGLREVLRIPSLGLEVPAEEIRRSLRVEANIPFSYRVIENKIVMPQTHKGTILDISYHGILADIGQRLPLNSDIKLDMDLSLIGFKATDIYAKVVKTLENEGRLLAGLEFTSVSVEVSLNVQHFVQLLVQGSENR